jgi:hypothetical protein
MTGGETLPTSTREGPMDHDLTQEEHEKIEGIMVISPRQLESAQRKRGRPGARRGGSGFL